jgi:hypothetical protein
VTRQGFAVSDRPDDAARREAATFLDAGPVVVVPRRGVDYLRDFVETAVDENQPFYRVLSVRGEGGGLVALLSFGLVVGAQSTYEFSCLAASDEAAAWTSLVVWDEWLERAGTRNAKLTLDESVPLLLEKLPTLGFAAVGRIPDFYARGEAQLVWTKSYPRRLSP